MVKIKKTRLSDNSSVGKALARRNTKNSLLEKKLEERAQKAFDEAGFFAFKWTSLSSRGLPDKVVFGKRAKCFFVEFKRHKGKVSELQSLYQTLFEGLGFNYYVCRSLAQVKNIIKNESGT